MVSDPSHTLPQIALDFLIEYRQNGKHIQGMCEHQPTNRPAWDERSSCRSILVEFLDIARQDEWDREKEPSDEFFDLDVYCSVDLFVLWEGADSIIAIHDDVDDEEAGFAIGVPDCSDVGYDDLAGKVNNDGSNIRS